MKRSALWCLAVLLVCASRVSAQALTMQMSNGWSFTFSGNVNAFWTYTDGKVDQAGAINGGLVPPEKISRIRTGLLPGFATFEAKGKEGGLDLGVHFGFAPQINSNSLHDNFGAQIDMRQVYLTVGGSWGQILAGREIGLFLRQNILTDITLFGTGASGGGLGAGGTTLGRIGLGYIYPNFNAQMTYSTPAGKPVQLSVGLFDPSVICGIDACPGGASSAAYTGTRLPRVEAELTWTGNLGSSGATAGEMGGSANKVMVWVNGMVQYTHGSAAPVDNDSTIT
ncbi:MAG: porin, partial [Gemmatimonadaceae bacterium]|nr:porin [Gemmatimonadaceae bacterium]